MYSGRLRGKYYRAALTSPYFPILTDAEEVEKARKLLADYQDSMNCLDDQEVCG
jgi:hypothetical protein